jgi:rfaE bifunctional protein nucleotidyltransferase chain/domain
VVDVRVIRESPGGAGLTALLCRDPAVEVTLVCPISDDTAGTRLIDGLAGLVEIVALPQAGPTRVKTRIRSAGQSLIRFDEGGPGTPVAPALADVRRVLESADVVLVSDYGAGTTSDPGLRDLLAEYAPRTPMVWDPHPRGGDPVPGVALVTPNLAEAKAVTGGKAEAPDLLAQELMLRWQVRGVCVTVGSLGAFLALSGSEPMFVPAPRVPDGDPCGAGDRFAASAALCLARGGVLSEAVVAAVQDASGWVAAGGAASFRDSVVRRTSPPEMVAEAGGSVDDVVARVRDRGGRVVATGGCFDVLHVGHIACLEAARRAGDALIVLLNSDDSVRRLKGPARPVVPAEERARVLRALASVDAVVVFDEDDPRAVLDRLRPDVWAKGGDYGGSILPEADLVRSWGGQVLLLPYVGGRSTTSILNRVQFQEVP